MLCVDERSVDPNKQTETTITTAVFTNLSLCFIQTVNVPSISEEKLLVSLISSSSRKGFLSSGLSSSENPRLFFDSKRWFSVSSGLVNTIGLGSLAGRVLFSAYKRKKIHRDKKLCCDTVKTQLKQDFYK